MLSQLTITLKWWQAGLYELAILSLGIIVGTYWPEVFSNWLPLLWLALIVPGSYIIFIWIRQNQKQNS